MNLATVTEKAFVVTATELFAVLVDPDTYPKWLVGTKNIREVSSDWPAPGSYFKHTVGFGPIAIPDRTTVRDVETPRMLTLFVRARPVVEAVVQFDVTSKGDTCTLRMTETPVGVFKVVAPLTRPLIGARNERSLQRLADFVDTQHAPGSP
ncbi:MAG: SRPBCC family protein [Mycobacterium sp.]